METKYTFEKNVYIPKLTEEIISACISVDLKYIDCTDIGAGAWVSEIWFVDALAEADRITLEALVSSHTLAPPTHDYIRAKITAARDFGQAIIMSFAADNVLLGITQAGMTTTVRHNLADILDALNTGSLYDAIHGLKTLPDNYKDSTYITNPRILVFLNKIEDYMGITRTISL